MEGVDPRLSEFSTFTIRPLYITSFNKISITYVDTAPLYFPANRDTPKIVVLEEN
jgi:hypothetical protein